MNPFTFKTYSQKLPLHGSAPSAGIALGFALKLANQLAVPITIEHRGRELVSVFPNGSTEGGTYIEKTIVRLTAKSRLKPEFQEAAA